MRAIMQGVDPAYSRQRLGRARATAARLCAALGDDRRYGHATVTGGVAASRS